MLDTIKVLLGITDTSQDALLGILMADAEDFALHYCNIFEMSEGMNNIICAMVCEQYNRLGNEGVITSSFGGGLSEQYAQDYSKAVYRRLQKFRKIKTVTHVE